MNKYQENLDFIVKNSCPQKTICRECDINNVCNCLVKEHIDSLQELVENHFDLVEKYKELEKALKLYIEWTTNCDFGYDNIPELYEKYEEKIKDMSYEEGLKYIALKEVEE